MAVKIRLARIGKKNVPFYRIVAVDGRKKRDGQHLENLGTYSGLDSKLVHLDQEGIDRWISQGAIPTDAVIRICKNNKVAASPSQDTVQKAPKKAKVAKKDAAQA